MGDGEPCTVVAAAEMHAAKAVATTEMHAAKAVPSAMTTAEMSATAVTTSRQRRTRQHGCDNQNGNSDAGLRHVICSSLIICPGLSPTQTTPGGTESSPRQSALQAHKARGAAV
jgi:hypothetical protein